MSISKTASSKRVIISLLFIFVFLQMASQIYATNQKQDAPPPIVPTAINLAEITSSPPQFPGSFKREAPEAIAAALSLKSGGQLTAPLAISTTSPSPFAPTGHFESTLMPRSVNITVGQKDTVFVFGSGSIYGSDTAVSHNQGFTWEAIEETNIKTLAISPVDQNHILMGSDTGIHISQNAGRTWATVPLNKTGGIVHLEFSPTYSADRKIYAASNGSSYAPGKMMSSEDGGSTWKGVPIPTLPLHFALAPNFNASPKMIAAIGSNGVLYSENGGQNWANRSTGLDLSYGNYIKEVFFSPGYATDNTIFALTNYGVYRSLNSGVNWSSFLPFIIEDFALDPNYGTNHTLYINASVTSNGETFYVLFRSQDNGQSFNGLVADVVDFAFSPDFPQNNTIYVQISSATYITTGGFNGLIRSKDNGATWYIRSETVPKASVVDLVTSPQFSTDETAFLIREGTVDGVYGYSLWKTSDLGFSWEMLLLPEPTRYEPIKIALSPNYAVDQTIIMMVSEAYTLPANLYKSVNGGQSWTLLNSNLPIEAARNPDLKLSPNYPQDKTIFISDYNNGLYRSQNNGQSWQQLHSEFSITSFAIAPEYPTDNRLFISSYNQGILRSNNGGTTWTLPNNPGGLALIMKLSPNFRQDNTIFAVNSGTSAGGVWKSVDAGNSWSDVSGNNFTSYEEAAAISPNFAQDQTIAVQNRNLFLSEDAGDTWFVLEGIYNNFGLAMPYWQGMPLPLTANTSGFYIYVWPWQASAGFNCGKPLSLVSTELQDATIGVSLNSFWPAQWRVNSGDVSAVSWLSIAELEGMQPQNPHLTIDSSSITAPETADIGIDVFLSYRHYISVNAKIFLPCYSTSLPTVLDD
ncbi:MAG: hypothetical protein H6654_15365 [Ardenticatenaceae bacterium]|nr:hypothetical protein [Anaerolineales bacterium]MCB8939639.1 hypothetical protein [Ardenticatenaceae bacterium]MCB8974936.1 hypothetical protein [Ardenticatenaceae bacterium]